jgi:hypothetical protein
MVEHSRKPRLTRHEDVLNVVVELRKYGITGADLYHTITDIGPVDLDLLNEVLALARVLDGSTAQAA